MPQHRIFIEGTTNCIFQEYRIQKNTDIIKLKKSLLKVYEKNSDQLFVIIAFGKSGIEKLHATVPKGLSNFEALQGVNNLHMPSTQSEIFIWAHSHSKSEIFDFTTQCKQELSTYVESDINQEGFRYHDSRDLTGFVDGSANPKGNLRQQEALIPKGEKHENGCFVFTQKWQHHLESFHGNPVQEQEQIIGRTKEDSIELEGDMMPNNSHVSRTDVKVKGEAMKIYRRSYPYANEEDQGLFFLGFAKNINRIDIQLKRMLGITEDKISDRLMEFSTPLTGSYYFLPSSKELSEILSV